MRFELPIRHKSFNNTRRSLSDRRNLLHTILESVQRVCLACKSRLASHSISRYGIFAIFKSPVLYHGSISFQYLHRHWSENADESDETYAAKSKDDDEDMSLKLGPIACQSHETWAEASGSRCGKPWTNRCLVQASIPEETIWSDALQLEYLNMYRAACSHMW